MKRKIMHLSAIVLLALAVSGCDEELTLDTPGALVPVTVDQDPSLPSISANGTRLHSEAFGDPTDPMVVFLHGGPGGDYRNGMKAKELVQNNYYVVFYDQRGSGLSARHPKNSFSIELMFDDLAAVITHYRTSSEQKVFLFGHSWGSMLAAGYINKYPDAVDGVILAETGGFTWEDIKTYGENSRQLKLFNEVHNDALYPDQFLNGDKNDHEVLDYRLALAYPFTYAEGNEEGIEGPSPFWRNGVAVLKKLYEIAEDDGFDFRSNLDQFTTKALFLYSENNRAYGEAFAQREASAFPNVQLSRVDATGHEMIYFGWENVHALVLPYLNSLR